MDVYWLEQSVADVPADENWLSPGEMARLQEMRFAKRRADWRLGRWTAKRTISIYLGLTGELDALKNIEIRAASSGAPEVFCEGKPAALTISLSHRSGIAMCALASAKVALGCDLEIIERRSEAFIADYFTKEEQELIAHSAATERDRLVTLLWSAKESALKALRVGLRLDTRDLSVRPAEPYRRHAVSVGSSYSGGSGWIPLQVRCSHGALFEGWWNSTGKFVRTLLAAPAPAPPILLSTYEHPQTEWFTAKIAEYAEDNFLVTPYADDSRRNQSGSVPASVRHGLC